MGTDSETACGRRHLTMLFEREVGRIVRYLQVRVGQVSVAEDLAGEVFAAAAVRCAEGRHVEVTGAWLQAVAHRRLVDHWRRTASRRRLYERVGSLAGVESQWDSLDEPFPEVDQRVLCALDSLAERQRAALCLRYLDDYSVGEVADLLDVGYQAAESLLARARRSFAQAFEELS